MKISRLLKALVGASVAAVGLLQQASEPPTGPAAALTAKTNAADRATFESNFAAFSKEVDATYPFFELKGIREDWNQTKTRLSDKVKACESGTEFLGLVIEAIGCLRDSHMGLRDVKAPLPERPKRYCPGLAFLPATEGRVIVLGAAEQYGDKLKPGTVVTRIDGQDARAFLDTKAKELWTRPDNPFSVSSPQRARLYAYRLPFAGPRGASHTLCYRTNGAEQELSVTCEHEVRGWVHTYNLPAGLKRARGSVTHGRLPSGAGYLYLRNVGQETELGIRQALETHAEARGWIVDLRGNGGGGYDDKLIERLKVLPRPVAVLIDAGCISAGETLARDLARHAGARLLGSRTAGSSSSKRTWTFPSGLASVTFSTRSRWRADGQPIEFNGIVPDVEIEAVPEEVARGLNSEILRAEEYLAAQLAKPPTAAGVP
jgi:hypothetical protein